MGEGIEGIREIILVGVMELVYMGFLKNSDRMVVQVRILSSTIILNCSL